MKFCNTFISYKTYILIFCVIKFCMYGILINFAARNEGCVFHASEMWRDLAACNHNKKC